MCAAQYLRLTLYYTFSLTLCNERGWKRGRFIRGLKCGGLIRGGGGVRLGFPTGEVKENLGQRLYCATNEGDFSSLT